MNEQGRVRLNQVSPIKNKVGSIFIPVRNLEKSRRWYCQVLGLKEADCEMMNGHLWSQLALDLGYHDQTHLIKAFKSVIGMTPDEFRKRRASGGESLPVEGV